jgi:hypothetical protein
MFRQRIGWGVLPRRFVSHAREVLGEFRTNFAVFIIVSTSFYLSSDFTFLAAKILKQCENKIVDKFGDRRLETESRTASCVEK